MYLHKIYYKFPFTNKRFKFIKSLPKNARILDYGCGDSYLMSTLLKYRPDIKCVSCDIDDFSDDFENKTNMDFVKIKNGSTLPFQNDEFDGVFINHVLEHLPKPWENLNELNRVMKIDALLYAESPATRTLWLPSLNDDAAPMNFFDDFTHIRPFSKKSMSKLMKNARLKVLQVGIYRNLIFLLLSPLLLPLIFIKARRSLFLLGFTSLVGWSTFVIAQKK